MTEHASHDPSCESCGRGADVALSFADTTFKLCLRCVPLERRAYVVALPGHEQLVELMLGFLAAHQSSPVTPTPAGTASTR